MLEIALSRSKRPKMARLRASYFGLMSEVDTQLGRLFNELKQGGQWDNTLVIFTSDHGEQLGHHHLLGKLGYFDDSYHVPLIVRLPASLEQDSRPNRVGGFHRARRHHAHPP